MHNRHSGCAILRLSMNTYPPTAKEIRDYFDKNSLTRRAVASMVRCEPRTVSKWKAGDVKMPYSIWYVIRLKVEHHGEYGLLD